MVINRGDSLIFGQAGRCLSGIIGSSVILTFVLFPRSVTAVGCYVCNSINGSDPTCEDPFNPNNSTYIPACMEGKKDIIGLFPTRYCVKMSGSRWSDEMQSYIWLYIRRCAVESLGEQTGSFVWPETLVEGGQTYIGSILTCNYNGCNLASRLITTELFFVLLTSATIFAWNSIRIPCLI